MLASRNTRMAAPISAGGGPVESHFIWRPQLRDASDEMVLEAAVNGGAGAIISFNQRGFGAAPARFGIRVLLPRNALRSLPK